MSKSIVGIANTRQQVEAVLHELDEHAVPPANISVLLRDYDETLDTGDVETTKIPTDTTAETDEGGIGGAALGALAGSGTLDYPSMGSFVAMGPIMDALSGAAVGATGGGFVSELLGLGIPESEAKIYENRIQNGGSLIAVHVSDPDQQGPIREILERQNLEDISAISEE